MPTLTPRSWGNDEGAVLQPIVCTRLAVVDTHVDPRHRVLSGEGRPKQISAGGRGLAAEHRVRMLVDAAPPKLADLPVLVDKALPYVVTERRSLEVLPGPGGGKASRTAPGAARTVP